MCDSAPHTGTTIVAVAYDGGVVIGADSRVSTGTYVSNRASDKLTELTDSVWLGRSGSAAHCQVIADYVRWLSDQHSLELQEAPGVQAVANMVMQMSYSNQGLIAALIVAGWDAESGGQVWGCPIGGSLMRQDWTTDGSGSTYIWGFLDSEYRENMNRSQAESMVKEALVLAMSRDGSSGGVARMVTIHSGGTERTLILPKDVPAMWDELEAPIGMVV